MDLLDYWADEPPAHVTLALRYLGQGKRGKTIDEAQARKDMGQIGQLLGKQAQAMPDRLKAMVRQAEQLKRRRRGGVNA